MTTKRGEKGGCEQHKTCGGATGPAEKAAALPARTLGSGVVRQWGEVWQSGWGLETGEVRGSQKERQLGALDREQTPSLSQLLSHLGETTGENVNTLISSFPISWKTNGKGEMAMECPKYQIYETFPPTIIFSLGCLLRHSPSV